MTKLMRAKSPITNRKTIAAKKERRFFYSNLGVKNITNNKRFWKTWNPFFSDKGANKSNITLIDRDNIIYGDLKVNEKFNSSFDDAILSLCINE